MNGKPVSIMVAVGPFTTQDNLGMKPLINLMEIVQHEEPHLLILQGPFIDTGNEDVSSGQMFYTSDRYRESANMKDIKFKYLSYDEMFAKIAGYIDEKLSGLHTTLMMVPSLQDAHVGFPLP